MSIVAIYCIVIGVIILFGIIDYISEIREIGKNQDIIVKFRDVAVAVYNKLNANKKADQEIGEVMSTYKLAYRVLQIHCYRPAPYSVMAAISNGDNLDLNREVVTLNEEVISTYAEFNLDREKLLKQWWNVFNYFFRGVGLILRIVFGYPIQMIKPSFDFKSKGWNIFSAIIGLLGSLASIIAPFIK